MTREAVLDINSWKQGPPPPWAGHLLRDCYQTPANSKETYRGDSGHLSPTPRSTPNWKDISKEQWEFLWSGGNGSTQVQCGFVEGGTQSSESLPRRDGNLGPPYHVHNRTRSPKTYSQNTFHLRSTKNSENDHRTIVEIDRLGEPTRQQRIPKERTILGLFS
jgi:hypothetical protein